MEATIKNMRAYYRPGVFAYSPDTGEEYSANPGDYWNASDAYVMRDANNDAMLLVTAERIITPVSDGDHVLDATEVGA